MAGDERRVAVVCTVKNDPRVVPCVEAILDQDTSFRYTVVVVDNESTDDTPKRLQAAFGDDDRVELLSKPGHHGAAWNEAARASGADVLVRIDADTRPEPGWLEAMVAPILDGDADWTAGPVTGVRRETLVERYIHHRTERYCKRLEQDPKLRGEVPSWNTAYTREALDRAGWFDPWQASSPDWCLHKRINDAGLEGRYAPDGWIEHHHPRTLSTFASKEAWYRTGHYQMMLKYGAREVADTFLLPGAYALVVALLAAGIVWPISALAGLVLLAGLLVKHAQGGLSEDDPMWWARPIFRPIEAFAGIYGLLRGLVRYGVQVRSAPGPVTETAAGSEGV